RLGTGAQEDAHALPVALVRDVLRERGRAGRDAQPVEQPVGDPQQPALLGAALEVHWDLLEERLRALLLELGLAAALRVPQVQVEAVLDGEPGSPRRGVERARVIG